MVLPDECHARGFRLTFPMFDRSFAPVFSHVTDNVPLAWWGRFPVYGTTYLVLAHMLCFVGTTLAMPLGGGALVSALTFSNQAVLQNFALWQVATYAFVHVPSLWFLIEMAMLYFFGTEVEKVFGRRQFFIFYTVLVLLPPLFLVAAGLFGPVLLLQGAGAVQMGIFLAFVALMPGVPIFFGIPAKWVWVGFLALNSLLGVAGGAWAALTALWLNTGATLLILRAWGVPWPFAPQGLDLFGGLAGGASESRSVWPAKSIKGTKVVPVRRDPVENIDPILEKIARKGLGSLTPGEKARLEKARAQLLAKERSS